MSVSVRFGSVLLAMALLASVLASPVGAQVVEGVSPSVDAPKVEPVAVVAKPADAPAGAPDGYVDPVQIERAESFDDAVSDPAADVVPKPSPPEAWSGSGTARGRQDTVSLPNGLKVDLPVTGRRESVTVDGSSAPVEIAERLSDIGVVFQLELRQVGGQLPKATDDVLVDGERGSSIERAEKTAPPTVGEGQPAVPRDGDNVIRDESGKIIGVIVPTSNDPSFDATAAERPTVTKDDGRNGAQPSGVVVRIPVADASIPAGISRDQLVVNLWTGCDEAGDCDTLRQLPTSVDVATGDLVVELTNRALALTSELADENGDFALEAQSTHTASYYGLGVTTGSQFGDYTSLPGSLSSYQVGIQTGHAEANYSFPIPPAVGPTPSVGLSYSSGIVDNFTSSTNSQGGVVGLGWSNSTSSITRAFRNCDQDVGGNYEGNNCYATGDESDGFTINLNGTGSRLAKIVGATGPIDSPHSANATYQEYRLETDPSWRVRRITDGQQLTDAIALAPHSSTGYWLINAAGQVHAYGAPSYGNVTSANTVVDIVETSSGSGYWVVTNIGEVYAYGGAVHRGSLPGLATVNNITAIEPTPSNNGYFLLGADGGIFAFGDASYQGSPAGSLGTKTAVGMAVYGNGGYIIMSNWGEIYAYGAPYLGNATPHPAMVDVVADPDGVGYTMIRLDGWREEYSASTSSSYGTAFDNVIDVEHDPSGGVWHLQRGGIVRAMGGASWLIPSNPQEYRDRWEVTTPDGSIYHFGYSATPTQGRQTKSIATVPVYDPGNGCSRDLCDMASSWQLDRVVDTVGNNANYFYIQKSNSYRASYSTSASDPRGYVRAIRPDRMEYGSRPGFSHAPAAEVVYDYATRPTGTEPTNLHCAAFSGTCTKFEPAFYETARLSGLDTFVRRDPAIGVGWDPVLEWVINANAHTPPSQTGVANGTFMRLEAIQQQDPNSTVGTPVVTYGYTDLDNRADDSGSGGVSALRTSRLNYIQNELGGQVTFTYGQSDGYLSSTHCNPTSTPSNVRRHCDFFPMLLGVNGSGGPAYGFFNKWKVVTQSVNPRWGTPAVDTDFVYVSDPQWRYSEAFGHPATDAQCTSGYGCNHWNDYRGHNEVHVVAADGSRTEYFFYTGMNADPTAPGTTTTVAANVIDHNGTSYIDHQQLVGRTLSTLNIGAINNTRLSASRNQYDIHLASTGVLGGNGTVLWPDTRQINTIRNYNWIYDNNNVQVAETLNAAAYDEYGNVVSRSGAGDTSTASDDNFTLIEYRKNLSDWVISLPFRTRTWTGAATSGILMAHTDFMYDQPPGVGSWLAYGVDPDEGQMSHTRTMVQTDGTTSPTPLAYTEIRYNTRGQVEKTIDPYGNTTEATYNTTWGYQTSVDGPLLGSDDTTTFEINPDFGTVAAVHAPDNQTTLAGYDWAGRLLWVSAPGTPIEPGTSPAMPYKTTAYGYYLGQGAASLVTTSSLLDPGQYLNAWTFVDGYGAAIQSQTPASANPNYMTVTTTSSDNMGRPFRSAAPYDLGLAAGAQGYQQPTWTGLDSYTQFVYNADNTQAKVSSLLVGVGGITDSTSSVHINGLLTTITDPLGRTATQLVDPLGRIVTSTDPAGETTTYIYAITRRLDKVHDATANLPNDPGNVTDIDYFDPGGLRAQISDPDSGVAAYTYDIGGRVDTQTDARGTVLSFTYDALGRQTEISHGAALLARWNYDPTGAIGLLASSESFVDRDVTVTNGYDTRNRLTSRTWDIAGAPSTYTFQWDYRESGAVNTLTYPDGEIVTHGYNHVEQPTTLTSSIHGALVRGTDYEPWGAMSDLDVGNGTTAIDTDYTYEPATQRLATLKANSGGVDRLNYQYRWDDTGNLTRLVDSGEGVSGSQFQCFTYDSLNRLDTGFTTSGSTCAGHDPGKQPDPFNNNWDYDAIGNITLASGVGTVGGDGVYTYGDGNPGNPGPHAVTEAGNNTYDYDATGNMTSRNVSGQATQTLEYDAQNRLDRVLEASIEVADFVYDADGVRVVRQVGDVTTYAINELYEIEVDASTVGGSSIDEPTVLASAAPSPSPAPPADVETTEPPQDDPPVEAAGDGPLGLFATAGGPLNVLLVSGNGSPHADDVSVKTHLEGSGHTVTVLDDDNLTSSSGNGYDLVLVSDTTSTSKVTNKLENAAVSVVFWKSWVFDDNELNGSCGSGLCGTTTSASTVTIVDPTHPLAGGLSGTVTILTSAKSLSYGKPGAGATIVATHPTDSTRAVLFGYDTGDSMDGNLIAPERRVGLFMRKIHSGVVSTDGWILFDAAVDWAADNLGAPTNQAPVVSAGPNLTVTLPAGGSLDGTVTDDGLPTPATVTTTWSQISGPANAVFANAVAIDTTVTFPADGTYVFELSATDTVLTTADQTSITVNAASGGGSGRVTAGLVVLYEFEETSGTAVADTSGNGTPLNLTIDTPAATSWTGDALAVSGDTLVSTTGAASKINTAVTASDEITVEAWVDTDNLNQNGPARIVTISSSPTLRNVTVAQGVFGAGDDRVEARLRSTGTSDNGTPATATPTGALDDSLQHLVFTRDTTGTTVIYIDGVAVTTSTGNATGNLSNWDTSFKLGLAAELDGSRYWHGDFHLVAIYDQALTAAEVSQNFGEGADPGSTPPPSPVTTLTSYYTHAGRMIGYTRDGVLSTVAAGHLGSTEITNSGTDTNRQTYLPFGPVRNAGANALSTDHTYTGQIDDGLGWAHYRARQYDPILGRFLQADPLTVDGLNRYSYVTNNPLKATDPSGLCVDSVTFNDDGTVDQINIQAGFVECDGNAEPGESQVLFLDRNLNLFNYETDPEAFGNALVWDFCATTGISATLCLTEGPLRLQVAILQPLLDLIDGKGGFLQGGVARFLQQTTTVVEYGELAVDALLEHIRENPAQATAIGLGGGALVACTASTFGWCAGFTVAALGARTWERGEILSGETLADATITLATLGLVRAPLAIVRAGSPGFATAFQGFGAPAAGSAAPFYTRFAYWGAGKAATATPTMIVSGSLAVGQVLSSG